MGAQIPSLGCHFSRAVRHYMPQKRPDYNPTLWKGAVQFRTNCYAYALDIPDHGWALPGQLMLPRKSRRFLTPRARGQKLRDFLDNCLVNKDGLIAISPEKVGDFLHVISLILYKTLRGNFDDFHSCRLDSNGFWSYKDGDGQVFNTDESGNSIVSPEVADWGDRAEFIGCYAVPPEGICYKIS